MASEAVTLAPIVLASALQKAAPDNDLPKTAMDYLSIAGLAGSPMRRDE